MTPIELLASRQTQQSRPKEKQPEMRALSPRLSPFGPWDRDALEPPLIEPGDLLNVLKGLAGVATKAAAPLGVGLLKLLDLPSRRAGAGARGLMVKRLYDSGVRDADRLWQFLAAHPRPIEVRSVPRIPRPTGTGARIPTTTSIPPDPTQPIAVTVSRDFPSQDRVSALAQELARAANALADRPTEPFRGLEATYRGVIPLSQNRDVWTEGREYLPAFFAHPEWVQVRNPSEFIEGLQRSFPLPPGLAR